METLIGILLYIGAIAPNTTYTAQQIDDLEQANANQIETVEQDPVQMQEAEAQYEMYGPTVLVLDEPLL